MQTMKIAVLLTASISLHTLYAQTTTPTHHPATTTRSTANPYAAIDQKALAIPDSSTATAAGIAAYINGHFSGEAEKVRAIYVWTASNIQYDVSNMYVFNYYQQPGSKVSQVLATRKGVCEHYASLFTDLCQRTGIESYVVTGYTKSNGYTDYVAHAWSIARIDNSWYFFDPTWGAGYVNAGKFVPKLNNAYFKVLPSTLIKTHMPFDYLWQALYYPVTSQQFYDGKVGEDKTKPYFNFPDSIVAYAKADTLQQYAAAARRLEQNGLKNNMSFSMLGYYKRWMEIDQQNREVAHQNAVADLYNNALGDENAAVRYFNQFIDYYNKQFKPERPDAEIQAMLDVADSSLKAASAKLDQIKEPGRNAGNIQNFRTQIADIQGKIDEQQAWLKKYFAKGKLGRKSMFRKITWFGVPLN